MAKQPFAPHYGTGIVLAITAASQSVNLPSAANGDNKNVVVSNTGASAFYVRISPDGSAATTADMPILPGKQATLTKFGDLSVMTFIGTAGGTGHVIAGEGFLTS